MLPFLPVAKAIVRVNVFRTHRQTVQYVAPQHAERVAGAELLIIDEAAAIPLPVVKSLLGPYLVFLCSTVNGYEGTGRSLSLKLIQQLRVQGAKLGNGGAAGGAGAAAAGDGAPAASASASGRIFKEVLLQEPIRYAAGDAVERWLNELLCLDAAEHLPRLGASRLPHPDECELYVRAPQSCMICAIFACMRRMSADVARIAVSRAGCEPRHAVQRAPRQRGVPAAPHGAVRGVTLPQHTE
jgi:tRNA(Met) C34 N-acetyltransferase TmcA